MKSKLIVVMEGCIYVYNLFKGFSVEKTIKTFSNIYGACAINSTEKNCMLATLGMVEGILRIENYNKKTTELIHAFENGIQNIAISLSVIYNKKKQQGKFISVAESTGRYIKIYNLETFACLHSFKRGIAFCTISNSTFDVTDTYYVVSSSNGTVHIFSLELPLTKDDLSEHYLMNAGAKLFNNFKTYLPCALSFTSSVAKLHLDESECKWITKESTFVGPIATFFGDSSKLVLNNYYIDCCHIRWVINRGQNQCKNKWRVRNRENNQLAS